MAFKLQIKEHLLRFRFPAGTSRGVMQDKKSYFLLLFAEGKTGIGEAGPLPGLSIDSLEQLPDYLSGLKKALALEPLPENLEEVREISNRIVNKAYPSVKFALETALLDWLAGGKRTLFATPFSRGETALPINGLVWMGDARLMRERIAEKLAQGFRCLKMKVGAVDFEQECQLLAEIRQHYSSDKVMLRLDANGAFTPLEAMGKLSTLARYDIHSIEQPIMAGQEAEMQRICKESPIPIALDEELIGIHAAHDRNHLLEVIQPAYLILKPSLVGGLAESGDWIRRATERKIGWWMTSALESNIGLNAIAQFTSTYQPTLPQGLGTGQLYHNNLPSPLEIRLGELNYRPGHSWDVSQLLT